MANDVLIVEIGGGGFGDDGGRLQADALPGQAAVDAPAQDSGRFGHELGGQLGVALVRRDFAR